MSKISKKKFLIGAGALATTFVVLDIIGRISKSRDNKNIDNTNQYIGKEDKITNELNINSLATHDNFYLTYGKRMVDKILSFTGLIALAPVYAAISLAIIIDDPGPIFFTQKRVGKNKHFFYLHKFRSMKMATPHDMPTHMLSNPEQYITRVGKFLRKSSLDELPQIWDIFVGNMSVIGPRPALWNQDDLIAERDRYGANEVLPGLTGWAQINGRDELVISDKAKLDGEYVSDLYKSSREGFKKDVSCFFGTIKSVSKADGVVEGGTGEIQKKTNNFIVRDWEKVTSIDAGFSDYACYKDFYIDESKYNHKRVLITGSNSYIGESFKKYAKSNYPSNFEITTLDLLDPAWRDADFSKYDCVYHVAGIAHSDIGNVSDDVKKKYYEINTDLAIEVCKKCKESGVKQFILMSSMIIYGDSESLGHNKIITEKTLPSPANFYGDSKWQADKGVRKLQSDQFKVAVIRAPMIYGQGSKGNFPLLVDIAKKLPVFPEIDNQRSMLYIENLCKFLCMLVLSAQGGIYFPQNKEYVKTSDIVKIVNNQLNKQVFMTKAFNPMIAIVAQKNGKVRELVNKAFGNLIYDQKLSVYRNWSYCDYDFETSIKRSVITQRNGQKKALMMASVASMIDLFNKDNIKILRDLGYKVDVAANFQEGSITSQERVNDFRNELKDLNIDSYDIPVPRDISKTNEIYKSYKILKKLVEKNHYDIVHCQSPIGGVVCRLACAEARKKYGTKVIYTAHGFHFFTGSNKKSWVLYYPIEKYCSKLTDVLITINHEDYQRAKEKFQAKKIEYVPGIGIDIADYNSTSVNVANKRNELGFSDDDFIFMSTGQLSVRKNHKVVIKALSLIKNDHVKYLIVGAGELEEQLKKLVEELHLQNRVIFTGYREDVNELLHCVNAFAFPSLQEGLPVSLMEAMACGLPVVCSRIRGNTDLIEDGNGGYLCDCNDYQAFSESMNSIVKMDNKEFGKKNSEKIKNFDLKIVHKKMLDIYLDTASL